MSPSSASAPWTVLVVDDDPDVIEVTRLVLEDLEFEGRRLNLLQATSLQQARALFCGEPPIAVALIDVVMESEHAGLDLVMHVRNELGNPHTRLIIRTGNPGAAPPLDIVRHLEIDGYSNKAELTAERLVLMVLTALRSYRHLMARDGIIRGLEQTLLSGSELQAEVDLRLFLTRVLAQFTRVAQACGVPVAGEGLIFVGESIQLRVMHPDGGHEAVPPERALPVMTSLAQALEAEPPGQPSGLLPLAGGVAVSLGPSGRGRHHLWLPCATPLSDEALAVLRLFQRVRQADFERLAVAESLADLVSMSADWFWETDAALRITRSTLSSRPGWQDVRLLRSGLWELPFRWTAEERAAVRPLLQKQQPLRVRWQAGPRQGDRWYELIGKPMFDVFGEFAGYRGVGRDVTSEHAHERSPRMQTSAPSPAASDAQPVASQPQASSILLAEDDAVSRKLMQRLLESRGHRVRVAGNGVEAVALASQLRPDVILMDMQMPDLDGLAAARQIRAKEIADGSRQRVPIVALTANTAAEDAEACFAAGMDAFLPKPVAPAALFGLIDQMTAGLAAPPAVRR